MDECKPLIIGQRQSSNCPFGNGNGYGDGRAISVGEVVAGGYTRPLFSST